ncbi:MAG: hypothetical protein N2689_01390 [Verrucomicrobiae bacterium]|nr:hypothetical protein [Verrucomicrobiae bacterium]
MSAKNIYTVICKWRPGLDACKPRQWVMVAIQDVEDAQDAADNACLFLIRHRQGQAEAKLVIEGAPRLFDVHGGVFDAEEYDETITFNGKIVSVRA